MPSVITEIVMPHFVYFFVYCYLVVALNSAIFLLAKVIKRKFSHAIPFQFVGVPVTPLLANTIGALLRVVNKYYKNKVEGVNPPQFLHISR
nr:MAG TPA: hypothetical protein [Caudoviricetes sp.]